MQMTSDMLLLPSMMCADFGHLYEEVLSLQDAGADGFHLDLMDGSFVPNYSLGFGDIEWIARHADIPCDVHLMIQRPERYIDRIAQMGVKVVYVHPESCEDAASALDAIRAAGMRPGIAVNPEVPVSDVSALLPKCDFVLAMTVHPGFAGQRWIPAVDRKIEELSHQGQQEGFAVVVDGNCSPENISRAYGFGARGFVLGTAGLFGHGSYRDSMAGIREIGE